MSNFLFSGFYGYRNIGDDVFCLIADWGSRKFWGAQVLSFMAQEIPELTHPAHCVIPKKKMYPGHRRWAAYQAAISHQNIVFFGGSILHSKQESWANLAMSPMVRKLGCKNIAAAGVSIGPFKSIASFNVVKKFLSGMTFIAVRDNASFLAVAEMNLDVHFVRAFDPAVLIKDLVEDEGTEPTPRDPAPGLQPARQTLGVSVCRVESYVSGDTNAENRRIETIISVLKSMKNRNINLRFFEFNGHAELGDSRVTEEVIAALGDYPWIERVPYNRDPKVIYQKLKSCDAIFGVRLHSAILAYSAGVPFVLVEYHRKCSDFLDEIKYHKHHRIGDCLASTDETTSVLNKLLSQQKGKPVWDFPEADARTLAMKNFTDAPFFRPI